MVKTYHLIKRIIDLCVSLLFLIALSPVLVVLALFIFISAGRPIIFKSERLGKDARKFTVYKFRTLVNGVERKQDGLSPVIVINKLAGFMRDTHLDEVLQLYNVVKGDIALIGPRPLDVPRYQHLKGMDSRWGYVFKIKPGMTCINQIARYSHKSLKRVKKLQGLGRMRRRNRLKLDRYYIQNESPGLDFRITLWTMEYLVLGFFTKMFSFKKD